MQRVVLHIDMDYFFAAIEERENPELREKAVVVCMLSGRSELSGSVSTCNYVAREFGIRSGMPCSRAKKLNPEAVFLPVRKDFYTSVSDRIMEILRSYADPGNGDSFEQISVDEAFLESSERTGGDFRLAFEVGMQIKKEIKEKENLTCSIGIGREPAGPGSFPLAVKRIKALGDRECNCRKIAGNGHSYGKGPCRTGRY